LGLEGICSGARHCELLRQRLAPFLFLLQRLSQLCGAFLRRLLELRHFVARLVRQCHRCISAAMDRSQYARQRGGAIAFLLQFRSLRFGGLPDRCFVGDLAEIHAVARNDEACGDQA
jgi:hypothetical protein